MVSELYKSKSEASIRNESPSTSSPTSIFTSQTALDLLDLSPLNSSPFYLYNKDHVIRTGNSAGPYLPRGRSLHPLKRL